MTQSPSPRSIQDSGGKQRASIHSLLFPLNGDLMEEQLIGSRVGERKMERCEARRWNLKGGGRYCIWG